MKFAKTIKVTEHQCENLYRFVQPGQWVELSSGAKGQYLGTSLSGCVIINWNNGQNPIKRAADNGIMSGILRSKARHNIGTSKFSYFD